MNTSKSHSSEQDLATPNQSRQLLPRLLRGVIPPMVTPLRAADELDVAGLECLIEHMINGGVHGIFILGTCGEGPSLSYRLRRELIERTCHQARGRVPLLVGITDTAYVEAVQLAGHAAASGAQAVVLSAPYYYRYGQPELADYLAKIVTELPLPLFLYNMPSMTKTQFEPETIRRAMNLEGIVGIKDSSGDMAYFDQLLALARERADWTVLVGPEEFLTRTMKLGGHGGVPGGANFYPRLFVDLYEAVVRGDEARETQLQKQLLTLGQIYQVGPHASGIVKAIKCALSLLGICNERPAETFESFLKPERERIRAVLLEAGLSSVRG
jgi:2-dehydro-3-deoxy-D-pentonate aldolase